MGLDQFLYRYRLYNTGYEKEEIMYWRKANEIQNFFDTHVEEVENCEPIKVELGDLIVLKNRCKEVIENKSLANDLMPTMSGFFFGTTDYDDWYFESLKDTYDKINNIVKEHQDDDYYEYYAWW